MYRGFGFVFSKLRCDIRALWSSDTRVWDLVLKGSDEASSLVELLSSTVDLIEGHVDATATNGSIWGGGWLALTATLSHFHKLELLGSGRNADLTEGQLDAFRH
jgi:hypothetical protein